jgi:hypothetical protein
MPLQAEAISVLDLMGPPTYREPEAQAFLAGIARRRKELSNVAPPPSIDSMGITEALFAPIWIAWAVFSKALDQRSPHRMAEVYAAGINGVSPEYREFWGALDGAIKERHGSYGLRHVKQLALSFVDGVSKW